MAPEIYKGVYNEKVDIWSLGIIIYKLVFGCYPFNTKTKE
jgi:serine/threonine protein kinase